MLPLRQPDSWASALDRVLNAAPAYPFIPPVQQAMTNGPAPQAFNAGQNPTAGVAISTPSRDRGSFPQPRNNAPAPQFDAAPPTPSLAASPSLGEINSQAVAAIPQAHHGPNWARIASIVAPALMALGGNNSGAVAMLDNLQRIKEMRERGQIESDKEERDYQRKLTEPREVGNSLIVPDGNGGYRSAYTAPQPFQTYAESIGAQPGSPEYAAAVRDYFLKGWSAPALQAKEDLEGVRYNYRDALQGDRLDHADARFGKAEAGRNYRHDHPAPRPAPVGKAPRLPTPSTVVGGIMSKQASGQPLTPAESFTLQQYRQHMKPTRNAGAPVRVNTPEDARKLPPGTFFQTPDGRVLQR